MGGAPARDRAVRPNRKWRKHQRRYREILQEIRQELIGADWLKLTTDRRRFVKAHGIVRTLRKATPEFLDREAIRKTRDDARAIAKAASLLEEQIEYARLSPEMVLRLEPERQRLMDCLRAVKHICEDAERNQARDDQIKSWCAKIAFTLLIRFSSEIPTSGSPDSTYRIVTSLLYEVLTGEAGRDLKRACDDHLKIMRPLLPQV